MLRNDSTQPMVKRIRAADDAHMEPESRTLMPKRTAGIISTAECTFVPQAVVKLVIFRLKNHLQDPFF